MPDTTEKPHPSYLEQEKRLHDALLAMARQYERIAETLTGSGLVPITGTRFKELGPLTVELGEALQRWDDHLGPELRRASAARIAAMEAGG